MLTITETTVQTGENMSNPLVEWRRHENIRTVKLPNKEQYYSDLMNIEHSWSGRIDGNLCNTFIMEAEQQLVNAIELFEMGYFDCAYYSLRSAVDMSTTMVFLADMPEEEREKYLTAWKSSDDFPIQGRMVKQLIENGDIFSDMFQTMPSFFADAKSLSADLNKYVHKQGLRHFYVSRNHPMNQHKSQEAFIKDFEYYLDRCIGVVAVMRLAIDPFPILLMDEEILYRCFDSMTEPYSTDFVDKYIGSSTVEEYKQTELYTGTYSSFIGEEKKTEATFNVVKHQWIDSTKTDEIISQLHLLTKADAIATLIVAVCEKAVKVYTYNGILMFYTDRKTNRTEHSWNSKDFTNFANSDSLINQVYDEAFISVFNAEDEPFFVEHNELLNEMEVKRISNTISGYLSSIEVDNESESEDIK